jgi:hypothetical protein
LKSRTNGSHKKPSPHGNQKMSNATIQIQSMTAAEASMIALVETDLDSASMTALRFYAAANGIAIEGNRTMKETYRRAIAAWQASKAAAAVAEVAAEVEPIALAIEEATAAVIADERVVTFRQIALRAAVFISWATFVTVYTIVASAWLLAGELALEYEVMPRVAQVADRAWVTINRSETAADARGFVQLYRPTIAWLRGWLVNLGWFLAQGRQAVFGG